MGRNGVPGEGTRGMRELTGGSAGSGVRGDKSYRQSSLPDVPTLRLPPRAIPELVPLVQGPGPLGEAWPPCALGWTLYPSGGDR